MHQQVDAEPLDVSTHRQPGGSDAVGGKRDMKLNFYKLPFQRHKALLTIKSENDTKKLPIVRKVKGFAIKDRLLRHLNI